MYINADRDTPIEKFIDPPIEGQYDFWRRPKSLALEVKKAKSNSVAYDLTNHHHSPWTFSLIWVKLLL